MQPSVTRRFTVAGHQVFIANSRGPQTLTKLAAETCAKPVNVKEAAHAGEVVVVTIPEKHISSLPADLFKDVPASVVVIDTGNYYPRQRDGRIDAIENGMPESQWVAQQLERPVIKAFNNIYAARLQNFGLPAGTTGRVAIPVAGDDPKAKAIVFRLVDDIGFDPIDAGSLAESWRQQPGTPVYGPDFVAPKCSVRSRKLVANGLLSFAPRSARAPLLEPHLANVTSHKGLFSALML
jgi:8-hydroxy-5-deazaflavin:NADPH oxidoreductase